ncbi:S8 family peptidase [Micromonospora sp. NPDC050187]|uniref:S8 family peptidase n=1 Tax=Micromonospora sp. NPDC050187 TaxID=3364277 RepID=UPI0037B8C046
MSLPRTRRGRTAALGVVAASAMVTAMIGTPAAAAPTTGTILNAGSATAVAGSYIVVLKDSAVGGTAGHAKAAVASKAATLAERYRATVRDVWGDALNGFSVHASEKTAKRLAADPAVAYVEQDGTVQTMTTQSPTPSWGLDRIDQHPLPLNNSYSYTSTGSGVVVYIIDTGIRTTHTDFGGRAVHGYDAVDGALPADDCNGHGTHVAGTAGGARFGVAKNVRLVAVRVLNCAGSGTLSGVISGVNWVTSNHVSGPAVANMSLGSALNTSLNAAVTNSIADGVTYTVAAGNSNADACNFSPASTPNAITVGATDSNDIRAPYSNWGSCVDIYAPGTNITSAWITSTTATNTISGTSMASPHVAGAAARVLQVNPAWTPLQVRNYLVTWCTCPLPPWPPCPCPPPVLLYMDPAF